MSPHRHRYASLALILSLSWQEIPSPGSPIEGPSATGRVPTAGAGAPPDGIWARDGRSDVDFVLLGGDRPVILRARLHVGEQGCHEVWAGLFERLHAYLDTDEDGILADIEAGRTPWGRLFARPYDATKAPSSGLPALQSRLPEVGVTPQEISSYVYESSGIGAVGILIGPRAEPGTEVLFCLLDWDGDGVIGPGELVDIDQRLRNLDMDEDETLIPEELAPPRSSLSGLANIITDDKGPASPVVSLASEAGRRLAARRIVDRFGATDTGSISVELLPGICSSRRRVGQDEVFEYLNSPVPDLLIEVSLGLEGLPKVVIRESPAPGRVRPEEHVGQGRATARCVGLEIEIQAVDAERQQIGASLRREFVAADRDKSGAVSAGEARGNSIIEGLLEVADRDADRSLTEEEVQAYRALANAVTSSRCQVMAYDTGPALYTYLDADGDGRLSIRELRGPSPSLLRLDRDGDGAISAREVPRRYVLQIGRGFGLVQGFYLLAPSMPGGDDPAASREARPGWFVAMDLNGDGDISPGEFHGPPAAFRQLDGDGDGLIDSEEAARFQKSAEDRPR